MYYFAWVAVIVSPGMHRIRVHLVRSRSFGVLVRSLRKRQKWSKTEHRNTESTLVTQKVVNLKGACNEGDLTEKRKGKQWPHGKIAICGDYQGKLDDLDQLPGSNHVLGWSTNPETGIFEYSFLLREEAARRYLTRLKCNPKEHTLMKQTNCSIYKHFFKDGLTAAFVLTQEDNNPYILNTEILSLGKILKQIAPKAYMYKSYGMTESIGALNILNEASSVKYQDKKGSVGVLLPSVEMKILSCDDDEERCCRAGEMGEIYLRSPRMLRGYFKNDEATRKAIVGDWYRTGDYGYFDEDEYVFILDRVVDLIKHKDGVILPTHVEGILRSHPAIKDCAVIGCDSLKVTSEAMAFVVRQEGCDVTAEEVQRFGSEKLAAREQLTGGIRFVESIPKSPAGKTLRRLLSAEI